MRTSIERFFAPPVFPGDESKTHAARTLNTFLLGTTGLLALFALVVPLIVVEKLYNTILVLVCLSAIAATWWLMRRGHVRIAGTIYVSALWAILTGFIALAGGMTSIVTVFYMATTVVAGLVLGTRAALVYAAACSLAGLGMTLLEISGYPPPRVFPIPTQVGWMAMTLALLLTIVALDLTLGRLNDALARARQELDERRKAEAQKEAAFEVLQESEGWFRALVQNSSDIITILEVDGTIRYQSPAAERVLGFAPEQRIGRNMIEFLDPDDVSRVTQALGELLHTPGGTFRTELALQHRDGSKRILEAIGLNLLSDPDIRGIVTNSRDITEQKRAAQALRESEARYRAMFEHTKNGMAIYAALDDGADFVFKDLNPSAERISRVAREDVIGKRLLDVFPHMDRFGLLATLQRVYHTGQPEQLPAAYYQDPYREGWREYYIYRLPAGDVVAIYDDVTARVQATEALRESEEKYQKLFESSPYAMALSSLETGTILEINESNVQLFGYPREEVIGTTSQDLDIWADWSERERLAEKLRQQGYLRSEEAEFVSKSGDRIHGLMSLEIVQIAKKKLVLGSWLDITDRKRAEKEIRWRAETLAALHETALDLAAQRALPDLLQAIVARAADLLQAKGGGIYLYRPATDDLEFVLAHNLEPDFAGAVLKRGEGLSGRVLETGQSLAVADYSQWAGRAPQYEQANFAATVAVPISWGNRLLGVLNVLDDAPRAFSPADIALLERFTPLAAAALENTRLFTETQSAYEELKHTQAQLIQSEKLAAIGQLAAGVAHELNNPLTSVLGFSELLLRQTDPDDPNRRDLADIAEGARRARDIVRNLLSFARQSDFHRLPTDVNQMVQETLALSRRRLQKSDIAVEERYAPDLPMLRLDVGRMKQVILNLITNALQAMPQGGTLTVTTERVGERVAVRVADTGAGISAEHQSRIFDPFFTTKPVGQGTGLGLSVSLGIVQEHGGQIDVESQEEAGSTFTVWLPVSQETPPDAAKSSCDPVE